MKLLRNALILSLMSFLVVGCTAVKPGSEAKPASANTNQPAGNSNVSQAKSLNNNAAAKTSQASTGSIEVTSTPPRARVLLVMIDEGGAGEPQPRGVTPTTITGVSPGKYTVDLEKPGYKFYQKDVVVKANSTAKINAALRKQ
ncbi:MAG TPA: PEGA domain-containing protein [Blastocatellia bacterium]|nr:PEGA domain-containing protein [Blastocatellia bacterium]